MLDAFIEARVDGLLFLGTMPVTEAGHASALVVSGREPELSDVGVSRR